jgi:hypothetical protein
MKGLNNHKNCIFINNSTFYRTKNACNNLFFVLIFNLVIFNRFIKTFINKILVYPISLGLILFYIVLQI